MSKTPYMPLWVSDFLGDTLDLGAAEIGAYLLLLMAQWNRDGASLPDDQSKLKRVARCGRNWPAIWAVLGRFFCRDENGVYSKRLRYEAHLVASKREVNRHNGELGGVAKSLKSKETPLANASHSLQRNTYRNSSISEPESYKKESDSDTVVSLAPSGRELAPISEAVGIYNDAAEAAGWPRVQKLSKARTQALKARLRDGGGIDGWRAAMDKGKGSDFLCGRTSKPWAGCGFDWLIKQANFTKLMEGNYDNRDRDHIGAAFGDRRDDPTIKAIAIAARMR